MTTPAKQAAPDVLGGNPQTPPVEPQIPPVEPEQTPAQPAQEPAPQEPKFTLDQSMTAMKQVDAVLQKAGLNTKDVVQQVNDNNGQVTPAIMMSLIEAHGEAMASLVAGQMTQIHNTRVVEAKKSDQATFDQVQQAFQGVTEQSGEDTWKELTQWTRDNVSKEEQKEINAMLKAGGMSRRMAVDALVQRFQGSDQYEQPADRLPAGAPKANTGTKGISVREYNVELNKLVAKGYAENSPERLALAAQRNKGRKLGL